MVQIVLSKFGEVGKETIDQVFKVIEECYNRLSPHNVTLLDLYIFDRSSSLEAFLAKECSEVGVASAPFDELFFAMHDAWRGTPRVILCLERMEKLPKLVKVGGIRHEVGHSVLHGSLSYYFLSLPPGLLELVDRFSLSPEYAKNLLYLLSIAVKDYEVTRLLHKRDYIRDQIAYVKHSLTVSENDLLAWKMAKDKPLAEILYLISCLKALSCAAPLLLDKACSKEIRRHLTMSLSHLPKNYSALLLEVISKDFPRLGADTLDNITYVTDVMAKKIVKPILERQTIKST